MIILLIINQFLGGGDVAARDNQPRRHVQRRARHRLRRVRRRQEHQGRRLRHRRPGQLQPEF